MVDAFPLTWPIGTPRTKYPKTSQFQTGFVRARNGLIAELHLLGAKGIVISSNIPLRRDGLPYAGQANPEDSGVAVYFTLRGESRCMCCDRWFKATDNIQAVRLTVAALRGTDRWGVGTVEQYFSGFVALPEAPSWYDTLELPATGSTSGEIKTAFKRKSMQAHPDKGGSGYDMNILTQARDQGLRAIEATP